MTAIVGTINRRGIAFAADSAATLSLSEKTKITNHTNKIFALSKHKPIGIAIYNNLDFHGVPWENVFKMYRDYHLKDGGFGTIMEYISDFFEYISSEILPKLDSAQKEQVDYMAARLSNEIIEIAKKNLEQKGVESSMEHVFPVALDSLKRIIADYRLYKIAIGFEGYTIDDFNDYADSIITTRIKDLLFDEHCPRDFKETFAEALYWIMMSPNDVYLSYTGLVFWGYGEDELFPSYYEYHVGIAFDGRIKQVGKSSYIVDNDHTACVAPFAQTDVANTVVRGIDQKLRDTINSELYNSFDAFRCSIVDVLRKASAPNTLTSVLEKIDINSYVQSFVKDLNGYITENYIYKLLDTVALLNKEDMADMAESLVRMTCLKRHVTTDEESVGGPVDVAVITKGDGFVWIKRKHYFDASLNYQFFNR